MGSIVGRGQRRHGSLACNGPSEVGVRLISGGSNDVSSLLAKDLHRLGLGGTHGRQERCEPRETEHDCYHC